MNADDLSFLPLHELAPLIASRQVSPVELVDAQLSRIEALDDVLRAFIFVDADNARKAAKAAEAEIAAGGYRGLLHGVTVAHKDIIDVQGLRTTASSKILSGNVAKEDATVTARLRAAGVICLGKLNLIEFASGSMGLYGFARNPHNLGANPGASSSGSGVATAAGFTTLATGTDTGGSVRNPASFCGLAGLRPTYGRVSRYGCVPLSWSQDSIGPMGRSVADIATMLGAMAGPDRHDLTAAHEMVPDYTAGLSSGFKGLRIGVPDSFFLDDLNSEVEAAMQGAISEMQRLGAEIRTVHLPSSAYAGAASWVIAYSESFVYHRAWFETRSKEYTPAFYHKITAAGLTSAPERIVAQQVRQQVTAEFSQAMQAVDIIVTPGSRTLASEKGAADTASITRPVSLAGYPGLSIPIGFASDGTPLGMQLIGQPWEEATLFAAGFDYERATGWNLRRPPELTAEIPPHFGENAAPLAEVASDAAVSTGWVMDMARLLDYKFVTEADARVIATMLVPIKAQLRDAQDDLQLSMEPSTRPAGVVTSGG